MRFLGDIPIGRATLAHLSAQGHDAIGAAQRLSPRANDSEIIRIAAAEQRVVLALDIGMATLVALSGELLPSVITFRTTRCNALALNRRLDEILPHIAADPERGALVTVDDLRVRIRRLPVKTS